MRHETDDMRDGSAGGGEDGVGEVADAIGAGWVGNGGGLRGARIFRGFVAASQFLIQVSEQQKKNRIVGIEYGERPGYFQRFIVMAVVAAKIFREIEARVNGEECAALHADFHLTDSFLFVSAGNAHEKAQ